MIASLLNLLKHHTTRAQEGFVSKAVNIPDKLTVCQQEWAKISTSITKLFEIVNVYFRN